ncbi:hypothetical protein CIPAW_16G073700 [Carya illinoinensis]|uniref:Non-haem dioxygenase N-terminal domain-containing protein n=1 Tax=Carya illinoinensis TaxID=32201 RepID=A0A8T1N7V3_CARIL|nr:hypothetical protein CIPAW_16G073700 [Carya illinoinensis]
MLFCILDGVESLQHKISAFTLKMHFQGINHEVASEVLQNTKDVTAEFFYLPLIDKNGYSMPSDDIQGYRDAYVVSEEQTLNWSDALILVIYPTQLKDSTI